jgi:hypothetical protein
MVLREIVSLLETGSEEFKKRQCFCRIVDFV